MQFCEEYICTVCVCCVIEKLFFMFVMTHFRKLQSNFAITVDQERHVLTVFMETDVTVIVGEGQTNLNLGRNSIGLLANALQYNRIRSCDKLVSHLGCCFLLYVFHEIILLFLSNIKYAYSGLNADHISGNHLINHGVQGKIYM